MSFNLLTYFGARQKKRAILFRFVLSPTLIYHSCNSPDFLWVKNGRWWGCHESFGHSKFAIHVRIRHNMKPMLETDFYVWQYIEILSKRCNEWTVWIHGPTFQAADEPLLPPQLLPDVPESLKSIENQLQSEKKCIELGVSARGLNHFWI